MNMHEIVKELLKENLSINVSSYNDWDDRGFVLSIEYDGEEITKDYFVINP